MKIRTLAAAFALAACTTSESENPNGPKFADGDTAYCITLGADYKNNVATMAAVALPSRTVTKALLPGAAVSDPVLRAEGGKLYVVNRSANSITVVDTESWTVQEQFSTGAGSNPQDVAVTGSKAYVAAYGTGSIQVWSLGTKAQAPAKTIDLSSYDPDGVPNANSMVIAGGRAYVTLDLLDTQTFPQPRGNGKIVVIDTQTDDVVTAFDLTYTNPYGFMFPRGDGLVVATQADFGGVDGCVEQIATGSTPGLSPCLVKNGDLGGTVSAIALGTNAMYLAVTAFDTSFNETAKIRQITSAGTLMPDSMTPAGEVPTDVAFAPSGQLVYGDQTTSASGGLRVYDLATQKEVTTAPLDIGLVPVAQNGIVCLPR